MIIGGLQRCSMIDYPGRIAAVVFTQGCNFRCPYCHNPELVDPLCYSPQIASEDIFSFLGERKGKLEGVVVTGGEPTVHSDLPLFIDRIKKLGFLVKLDTNGTNPLMIRELIADSLIDFIAMDIKAPLDEYYQAAGVIADTTLIRESIEIVSRSDIESEFRTTVLESLHTEDDIKKIGLILPEGKPYVVQQFRATKVLDNSYLGNKSLPLNNLKQIKDWMKNRNMTYHIR